MKFVIFFCHLNYRQVVGGKSYWNFFLFLSDMCARSGDYATWTWCLPHNCFCLITQKMVSDSVHAQAYSYKIIQIRYEFRVLASFYYSVNCPNRNLINVQAKFPAVFFVCLISLLPTLQYSQPSSAIYNNQTSQPRYADMYVCIHYSIYVFAEPSQQHFVPIFGIERCLQKLKEISFRISHYVHVAVTMCWALRSSRKTWIPWLDSKTEVLMWFFQSWFRDKILLVLNVDTTSNPVKY